jgi:hypothetical protein
MKITQEQQEALISLARSRGNRTSDFRDAVHEVSHVVEFGVGDDDWDRENIHAHIATASPHEQMLGEVNARATEWLACERAGIEYDPEKWVTLAALEAIKTGMAVEPRLWMIAIKRSRESGTAEKLLERVLGLIEGEL